MEFVIRKNATLPLLKMQVVKDGRGTYEEFMSFIETSTIYFSMQNIDNGAVKINTAFAGFVEKTFVESNATPEYYLYYRFSKRDTNKVGRFEGQFLLKNPSGTLVLPIREKLIINVKDSIFEDDIDYTECFVGKYECCIIGPPSYQTPTPSVTPSVTPTNTTTPTQSTGFIGVSPTPTTTITKSVTLTPTPSITESVTPTLTPTPSITETITQTPTLTSTLTPSPIVCNCYNFFNTGTTGNGTVDYISCGGVQSQSVIPPGDYGQVCLRGTSYTASSQIGEVYLLGNCTFGSCPTISANTCGIFVLNNQNRIIYLYDSNTNSQIPLPISLSATTPYDIATNDNLLWVFGVFPGSVTGIKEFTISRNPFTATLNRFITVGASVFPSAQNGLAVVNNTTLLVASGAAGTQIASVDITTTAATITSLFNLPSQRGLRGDLVYTNTGKIIVSTYNIVTLSDSRLQQFDYTGATEVDFSLGNAGNGFSFYVLNSEFYTVLCGTSSASRGKRNLTTPYGNTPLAAMTISNVGLAQPLSCYNINFT